jgi:hypothetical protein
VADADSNRYVRLAVDYTPPPEKEEPEAEETEGGEDEEASKKEEDEKKKEQEELRLQTRNLSERFSRWGFVISEYDAAPMLLGREELIEEPEEEPEEESEEESEETSEGAEEEPAVQPEGETQPETLTEGGASPVTAGEAKPAGTSAPVTQEGDKSAAPAGAK